MPFRRSGAVLAILLLSALLSNAAAAEKGEPTSSEELALKVKGWDCDG